MPGMLYKTEYCYGSTSKYVYAGGEIEISCGAFALVVLLVSLGLVAGSNFMCSCLLSSMTPAASCFTHSPPWSPHHCLTFSCPIALSAGH